MPRQAHSTVANPITPYVNVITQHFYDKSITESALISELDTLIKSYTDNPGDKSVYSFTTKAYEYLKADNVKNKLTAYLNMSFEIVRDIRICNYESVDQVDLHMVYKKFIATLLDVHGTTRNKVDVQFYGKCTDLDIKLVNARITLQTDTNKEISRLTKSSNDSFDKEFATRLDIESGHRMKVLHLERTHMFEIKYLIGEHLKELSK